MLKKPTIYLLFLIIFFVYPTNAQLKPGSQLWYSGFNSGVAGQGFGGVASKYSGFYSFINPANSATTENIRFFTSGNMSLPNWGGSFGISTPVAYGGTLYAGSQYLSFDGTSLNHIGYGKKVRSDLAFGIEGLITIHPNATKNNIGGGFNIGFLWLPKDFIPIKNGWGLVDFSLGTKWQTVFYPTSGLCFNSTPEMIFQVGVEATFMDFGVARWRFITDYAIGFIPLSTSNLVRFQTWLSIGNTWTFWNIWDISLGFIFGNNGLGFGPNELLPFTLGTALGYEWTSFSIKVSYAFASQKFFNNQIDYIHTIGLEMGVGKKNTTNMQVLLVTQDPINNTNYFSPNQDLIKDTVTFLPKTLGPLSVSAWRITILDLEGKVVKTLEDDTLTLESAYSAYDFFINYFTTPTLHNIPQTITWDGTDNNNQLLPEGIYQAFLQVRFNNNELALSKVNIIELDITPPLAELTIEEKFIYLGDNPNITLDIKQQLSKEDLWTAYLVDNEDNKTIAEWNWENETPKLNQWKLNNPNRINVATGDFSYIVTSHDKAGNSTTLTINDIIIETDPRLLSINTEQTSFSPNNDNYLDNITIVPEYGPLSGLNKSSLVIYNESGMTIYNRDLSITDLPSLLIWDGKNNQNDLVTDNNYIMVLEQHYNDKKQINSKPLLVNLDTTPPSFSARFSPIRLSPDNDGIDDYLKIDFLTEDLHNISNWVIFVKNERGDTLTELKGKEETDIISWIPSAKDELNSTDLISFYIAIQDVLGNKQEFRFHQIRIDILTDNKDTNLIKTKSIPYFREGTAILEQNLLTYLDEVWSYYQYHPQDKITILTQSYYEESNQRRDFEQPNRLAINRAESMKNYLINKGINPKNIDTKVNVFDEKNEKKQQLLRQAKIYIEKK